MNIQLNNYRIVTDDKQFIVQQKGTVKESPTAKQENVGKEYWKDRGYFTQLDSALKMLTTVILLDNDDLKIILITLNELRIVIKELNTNLKKITGGVNE